MANWQFWHYQKLTNNSIQHSTNTISVNTSLTYSKCSKCLPPTFTYSLNFFLKLWTVLFCGKFSHDFSNVTFNLETAFGFGWSFQNKLSASFPRQDMNRELKFGELGDHCFFWIICRQFACRHCWATHSLCTQLHVSHWICNSI